MFFGDLGQCWELLAAILDEVLGRDSAMLCCAQEGSPVCMLLKEDCLGNFACCV